MRISVVINTLNRAASLGSTLDSLTYQTHRDFEVVVVNGPSTDGTEALLARHAGMIKHLRCPEANLSMSRNIGLGAAAGEIVALIDDDAIPEYEWLGQLEACFEDEEVGAAGGVVFDHTGMAFQFRFAIANRLGDNTMVDQLPDAKALCAPGAWMYPSLMGTNTAFRRESIERIGFFDETYEYYLDETDVLLRLVDAGYVVRGLNGAPVHHHFLPSHIRNDHRVVKNWYPVVKNRTYFGLRHARDYLDERGIISASTDWANRKLEEAAWAEDTGLLPGGATKQARVDVDRAIADGIRLSHGPARVIGRGSRSPIEDFLPYPLRPVMTRRIALLSSDYPPRSMAGIARFTSDVAPSLVEQGCEVRVITRATGHESVAWEHGVWIHRISGRSRGLAGGSFDHVNSFATSAVREIARISELLPISSAYGPAWDVETLGVVRGTALPLTVMLATPAKVVAENASWMDRPDRAELEALFDLEAELFGSADLVHGISRSIVEKISVEYGGEAGLFDPRRVEVFPLGLKDRGSPGGDLRASEGEMISFVGRLERRKGIDTFLEAVAELAPCRPTARFKIAGADPDRVSKSSIAQLWCARNRRAPWFSRVEFLGEISDEELHRLYRSSDIVVLPSRFESFGLVVVEALMHGAAVVSSDIGGIPEFAQHGESALLVPPADVASLVAAVGRLLDAPDERRRLGLAGRARFESMLGIEVAARRLLAMQSRVRRLGSPEYVAMESGVTIPVTFLGGELGAVTIGTAAGAVIRLTADGISTEEQVCSPGRRLQLDVTADPEVLVELVSGSATLIGATAVSTTEAIP